MDDVSEAGRASPSTGPPELVAEVRAILARNAFVEDVDRLADEANLFDAGMNSLTAVRMALTIEDHFDVLFADDALTRESLGSITALARLLEATLTGDVGPG